MPAAQSRENYLANSFENKEPNEIRDWLLREDQRQVPQPTNIAALILDFSDAQEWHSPIVPAF